MKTNEYEITKMETTPENSFWRQRYTLVGLCCFATFICYIDRVNISVAIIYMAQEFQWNPEMQGRVLSAFFLGYLLTQIVGGRLADRYGGKLVLAAGVLLWSMFTVLTPPAAFLGFGGFMIARICMGMGEAVTFPSIYSLFARWVPDKERVRSIAVNASGIPLGTMFALLVTPWIVLTWGWEWAFYLFGAAGLIWFALWQRLTASTPHTHPAISETELEEIRSGAPAQAEQSPPPWREFLKRGPVWAIIVAHFCNNWGLYVLLSWLPTYVNKGLGVDFEEVGRYTMIPHLTAFIFLNIAGVVADKLLQSGMDVTRVRKLMQTIGFGGGAIALLIVGQVESAEMAIGVCRYRNHRFRNGWIRS
jgi:ACS family sodium-dependent inorganic phosphate cotransporter